MGRHPSYEQSCMFRLRHVVAAAASVCSMAFWLRARQPCDIYGQWLALEVHGMEYTCHLSWWGALYLSLWQRCPHWCQRPAWGRRQFRGRPSRSGPAPWLTLTRLLLPDDVFRGWQEWLSAGQDILMSPKVLDPKCWLLASLPTCTYRYVATPGPAGADGDPGAAGGQVWEGVPGRGQLRPHVPQVARQREPHQVQSTGLSAVSYLNHGDDSMPGCCSPP